MTEEFSLSDKLEFRDRGSYEGIKKEDVKEFIKKLEQEVHKEYSMGFSAKERFRKVLIKVFGDKLVEDLKEAEGK